MTSEVTFKILKQNLGLKPPKEYLLFRLFPKPDEQR